MVASMMLLMLIHLKFALPSLLVLCLVPDFSFRLFLLLSKSVHTCVGGLYGVCVRVRV